MTNNKVEILDDEEKIKALKPNDKEACLDRLEVNDIEGPADDDPLILTDFIKVEDSVRKNNLEIVKEREILSSGAFGPIYIIETQEINSGKKIKLIERCFSEIKDIERRFASISIDALWKKDSEPRYEISNNKDERRNRLIIDYLYNEEQALKDLQGIVGIPKFYGAIYDGLNGSILEEYIDGPDLSMLLLKDKRDREEWDVIEILEKVKKIYSQAAEAGYIHNDPSRATIMIDKNQQPYLADWYLYSQGNINEQGPIKDKYIQGLQDIENLQKRLLEKS